VDFGLAALHNEPSRECCVAAIVIFINSGERRMPGVENDPREERLILLEEFGIEEKALRLDKATNEVTVADNAQAMKDFYARAFQEWALGNLEGTAFEIFEDVTALLESDA
jgi:hypothetical protein